METTIKGLGFRIWGVGFRVYLEGKGGLSK